MIWLPNEIGWKQRQLKLAVNWLTMLTLVVLATIFGIFSMFHHLQNITNLFTNLQKMYLYRVTCSNIPKGADITRQKHIVITTSKICLRTTNAQPSPDTLEFLDFLGFNESHRRASGDVDLH